MEQALVALDERPPRVRPNCPAAPRAYEVTEGSGERDAQICAGGRSDRVAEEDHVLSLDRTRGERSRVHHHELATRRKDGVERHEQEDRVEPSVAADVSDRAAD